MRAIVAAIAFTFTSLIAGAAMGEPTDPRCEALPPGADVAKFACDPDTGEWVARTPATPATAPARKVVPVAKDKAAPFTGLLVPEARFKELLAAEVRVRELEVTLAVKEHESDMLNLMWRRRLEEAVTVPWYESPTLNRWLGFGFGIIATGFAVYGAGELGKL